MATDLMEVLSDHQLDTIERLVREAHRKSARAAERNRETGLVDQLPGRDADAVRAGNLEEIARLLSLVREDAEDEVPATFMVPTATPIENEALASAERDVVRAESERDAAEALTDTRGSMLRRALRMLADVPEAQPFVVEVSEHLRVTGEP